MSLPGRRRWMPPRFAVRRRLRPAPGSPGAGRWEQLVDKGPAGSRSYAVYTPPGLAPDTAVPLVVVLHGCNQSVNDAALGTDVNAYADRAGFVAVYPEQSVSDNVRLCWNWFQPRHQARGAGEPAAIARITERVLSGHGGQRLDRDRVHVMGLSAGGAMAGILAATYPDLYASAGIHSAPQFGAARSPMTALLAMKSGGPDPARQGRLAHAAMGPRARVVPVIVVQGDADRTVWAGNGDNVVRQWLTTSRLAHGDGAELDFARPHASNSHRAPGGLSYEVRHWNDRDGRPVVQYWMVSDLGHAWSGGAGAGSYTDPRGPSATGAMCAFFDQTGMERDEVVTFSFRRTTALKARAWMIRVRDLGRSGSGSVTNPDRTPG
jgi:poly(hydroxyalkanoate) depolymerase family esterase